MRTTSYFFYLSEIFKAKSWTNTVTAPTRNKLNLPYFSSSWNKAELNPFKVLLGVETITFRTPAADVFLFVATQGAFDITSTNKRRAAWIKKLILLHVDYSFA